MLNIDIVIMAAGKGTRMKSDLPKVLHKLAGRALLHHVLDTAAQLSARSVTVITGHGAPKVIAACADYSPASGQFDLKFVTQSPQLGTGHAVQQAAPVLPANGVTVVLSGDVPLTQADTLRELVTACAGQQLALLTIDFADPSGYGRVQRAGEHVQRIVEQKDASEAQKQIKECYSGIMAAPTALLKTWLAKLDDHNAQKEFYLTDVVKHAVAAGTPVVAVKTTDAVQVTGVNSPAQLQELEREYQKRRAYALMQDGVCIIDAARFDVRGDLTCERNVRIDVNCVFEGRVRLGEGVSIGANCVIANCDIAAGAVIHPFTHIDGGPMGSAKADGEKPGVRIGAGALIGPFARLRPGAQLADEVHIGNFVEVKNSTLAKGAKANHLAYLGDATVGERVNYGAGSITANYDGANKHRTVIEDDVHIGSNSVLVAPVTIGAGGTVGGGSTITKSTAPGALSIARSKQVSLEGWKRPVKKK
jgi:bifunctional UDP-N-acetylglucosamine pyrophosphorylase / glucosamine-1-phosphate N-acetyltransferase